MIIQPRNHAFFVENFTDLKAIKSDYEWSYDKQNLTLVVIIYEIYETRRRLVVISHEIYETRRRLVAISHEIYETRRRPVVISHEIYETRRRRVPFL